MFESEIELIKEGIEKASGTGHILELFLIIMFYIILCYKEKDNRVRIVFGFYSLIMLILCVTPIYTKIFVKVMGKTVYYRNYWIIPIMFTVAFGLTKVIYIFPNKAQRFCLFIASVFIIIICGKFVYHGANYQEVANYYKVPDSILEIILNVSKDDEEYKCLAGPYELQVYTRQVDGTILLSHGRSMSGNYGEGSVINQINYGNSERISELCYKNNYNYLVIPNDINLTTDLETLGFDKMMSNDKYTLYKMNSEKMEEIYK